VPEEKGATSMVGANAMGQSAVARGASFWRTLRIELEARQLRYGLATLV